MEMSLVEQLRTLVWWFQCESSLLCPSKAVWCNYFSSWIICKLEVMRKYKDSVFLLSCAFLS